MELFDPVVHESLGVGLVFADRTSIIDVYFLKDRVIRAMQAARLTPGAGDFSFENPSRAAVEDAYRAFAEQRGIKVKVAALKKVKLPELEWTWRKDGTGLAWFLGYLTTNGIVRAETPGEDKPQIHTNFCNRYETETGIAPDGLVKRAAKGKRFTETTTSWTPLPVDRVPEWFRTRLAPGHENLINNNELFWDLVTMGFRINAISGQYSSQDIDGIRQYIPEGYRTAFDAGLAGTEY